MRRALQHQVDDLRARMPEGRSQGRTWPFVRIMRDDEPDEPLVCERCGRHWHGLTRVMLISVDWNDV